MAVLNFYVYDAVRDRRVRWFPTLALTRKRAARLNKKHKTTQYVAIDCANILTVTKPSLRELHEASRDVTVT